MKQRIIVGMMGVKGAGKDTAAAFMCHEKGFLRLAFADKLYQEVADAFGVTVAWLGDRTKVLTSAGWVEKKELPQPELALRGCSDAAFVHCMLEDYARVCPDIGLDTALSPRVAMQYWGTEYRRKRGVDSYWLDIVAKAMAENADKDVVITDVRFPNENKFVQANGGRLLRIRNAEVEARQATERASKGSAAHASEELALTMFAHREIHNEMDRIEDLRGDVLGYVDELRAELLFPA